MEQRACARDLAVRFNSLENRIHLLKDVYHHFIYDYVFHLCMVTDSVTPSDDLPIIQLQYSPQYHAI